MCTRSKKYSEERKLTLPRVAAKGNKRYLPRHYSVHISVAEQDTATSDTTNATRTGGAMKRRNLVVYFGSSEWTCLRLSVAVVCSYRSYGARGDLFSCPRNILRLSPPCGSFTTPDKATSSDQVLVVWQFDSAQGARLPPHTLSRSLATRTAEANLTSS